jgi:hypothetical protein
MANLFDDSEVLRFIRTLRVTTKTALAQYEAERGRASGRASQTFLALAAKGPGEWRFPSAGLMSADGLILATLSGPNAGAVTLTLQAQGVVGLSLYAGEAARIAFASGQTVAAVFDRDGRLTASFAEATMKEADFAAFELQLADDAP